MTGEDQSTAPDDHEAKLRRLEFYRSEIRHEFALLSSRVNSYITSQSFLMIAYASAMNNANPAWGRVFTLVFPVGLAILGVVTSLRANESIAAAADTIVLWHVKQNRLFEADPAMDDYRVQRPHATDDSDGPVDRVHRRSVAFARLAPTVFLFAWIAFAILTLGLHLLFQS